VSGRLYSQRNIYLATKFACVHDVTVARRESEGELQLLLLAII